MPTWITPALQRFEPRAIDEAIRWLEQDRWSFRTGYQKEALWHHLRRAPLTARQRAQLEDVAVAYTRRGMSREFRYMCRTMARIASPEFWHRVETQARQAAGVEAACTSVLAAYKGGRKAGDEYWHPRGFWLR